MPLLTVFCLAALFALWTLSEPFRVARRRAKVRSQAFPAAWREVLRRRVPCFRRLPADLQIQLRKHIQVFVAEKAFVGCNGLVVTDEMRVTIAAQACLLILNRPTDYFPQLRQVLVYPGAFVVDRVQTDAVGVLQERRQLLSGESWSQGQVILSWEDAIEGAAIDDDGRNVVIHEFAHQLDQESGHANGAPLLSGREDYRRWSQVLGEAFARLQDAAQTGLPSLFSHYGSTSPAEFFAVASEVFFEQPLQMALLHPALYREFSRYYRVDPLGWQGVATPCPSVPNRGSGAADEVNRGSPGRGSLRKGPGRRGGFGPAGGSVGDDARGPEAMAVTQPHSCQAAGEEADQKY